MVGARPESIIIFKMNNFSGQPQSWFGGEFLKHRSRGIPQFLLPSCIYLINAYIHLYSFEVFFDASFMLVLKCLLRHLSRKSEEV